jgi:hypothetical protein
MKGCEILLLSNPRNLNQVWSSTQNTETGESRVWGQPGQPGKTCLKKKKKSLVTLEEEPGAAVALLITSQSLKQLHLQLCWLDMWVPVTAMALQSMSQFLGAEVGATSKAVPS